MAVTTTKLNISFPNNAAWKQTIALEHDDVPFSLAEYTMRIQLRKTPASDEVAIELSDANGYLKKLNQTGYFLIEVPASRVKDVPAAAYAYDLVLKDSGGTLFRPVVGVWTVEQGVTR